MKHWLCGSYSGNGLLRQHILLISCHFYTLSFYSILNDIVVCRKLHSSTIETSRCGLFMKPASITIFPLVSTVRLIKYVFQKSLIGH